MAGKPHEMPRPALKKQISSSSSNSILDVEALPYRHNKMKRPSQVTFSDEPPMKYSVVIPPWNAEMLDEEANSSFPKKPVISRTWFIRSCIVFALLAFVLIIGSVTIFGHSRGHNNE